MRTVDLDQMLLFLSVKEGEAGYFFPNIKNS